VHHLEENSTLCENNGIQAGDILLEIDGEKLYVQNDFSVLLSMKGEGEYDVLVERNGQKVLLEDVPMYRREFVNEDGSTSKLFGVSFQVVPATFGLKVKEAWNMMIYNVRIVRLSLQMLFSGKASIMDLTGPVGMVDQVSQMTAEVDTALNMLMIMLQFGAMLSVNLAVMNLLPLPALDGGRAVCLLLTTVVERIIGKKLDPKYEGYIHGAGMILLLLLMVVILFKDIFMIFKG